MVRMKYFRQQQGFSCGPACARMMLHSFGIERSEEELIEILDAGAGKGTPRENWPRLARKFDVEVITGEPGSIEELDKLLEEGWKVTVLVLTDVPHYISYLGSKDGRVYMHDPWSGPRRSLLIRNFYKRWAISPEKWGRESIYDSSRWYVAIKQCPNSNP